MCTGWSSERQPCPGKRCSVEERGRPRGRVERGHRMRHGKSKRELVFPRQRSMRLCSTRNRSPPIRPARIVKLLLASFATTRSALPSPLKSHCRQGDGIRSDSKQAARRGVPETAPSHFLLPCSCDISKLPALAVARSSGMAAVPVEIPRPPMVACCSPTAIGG